jgi:type II secretory pathway pseudopilin PulG
MKVLIIAIALALIAAMVLVPLWLVVSNVRSRIRAREADQMLYREALKDRAVDRILNDSVIRSRE